MQEASRSFSPTALLEALEPNNGSTDAQFVLFRLYVRDLGEACKRLQMPNFASDFKKLSNPLAIWNRSNSKLCDVSCDRYPLFHRLRGAISIAISLVLSALQIARI